jgi:hypothetical protein
VEFTGAVAAPNAKPYLRSSGIDPGIGRGDAATSDTVPQFEDEGFAPT